MAPITKHASPRLLIRGVRAVAGQELDIVVHYPTAPVWAAEGFARDSAFPEPSLVEAIGRMALLAAQDPSARLLAFGHTDESGSEAHNKGLSDRRARVLLALLTQDFAGFEQVAEDDRWALRQYQAIMAGLGIAPMAIDGKPGPQTTRGTKLFQGAYNEDRYHASGLRERACTDLTVDGILGPHTEAALRDAYLVHSGARLEPSRFVGPKFAGCGEFNRTGNSKKDRRVALALYGADFPTESKIPCKEGDAGSCKIHRETQHLSKCNFYRRTLEPEQWVAGAATGPGPEVADAPLQVVDPSGKPLGGVTVVVHCGSAAKEFQSDPQGWVDHAAFTQGAPYSVELKQYAGLASRGAAAGEGQEEEPAYDPGVLAHHDWCCHEHDEEALA